MTMGSAETTTSNEAAPGVGAAASDPCVVGGVRYVRAPIPVRFPSEERVPESKRHLEQRTLLYQILKLAFAEQAAVGCDQFVYWDPTDPKQCLAPDAFVRLGVPDDLFKSWKAWERGAPQAAVEIISDSDERDRDWAGKLQKYRRLGVRELVRFDPDGDSVSLRIWDGIDGDLIEREGVGRVAPSQCLPGSWVVVDDAERRAVLRLSRDSEGRDLYPTPVELEVQAHRRELVAAETRIRELEAELAKRR